MNTNFANRMPYLRTSRAFPFDDVKELSVELGIAYIETANAVNARTIGLFPSNTQAINGEKWYVTTGEQQGIRQAFTFTSTSAITHNLNLIGIERFIRGWGTFTDGTNWYGILFSSSNSTTTPGMITFYVTPTQIVFLVDAGAAALTSGTIVLEWLAEV